MSDIARYMEKMMEEPLSPLNEDAKALSAASMSEKEQLLLRRRVVDTALHEVVRQITCECAERGFLVERIIHLYRRLVAALL